MAVGATCWEGSEGTSSGTPVGSVGVSEVSHTGSIIGGFEVEGWLVIWVVGTKTLVEGSYKC